MDTFALHRIRLKHVVYDNDACSHRRSYRALLTPIHGTYVNESTIYKIRCYSRHADGITRRYAKYKIRTLQTSNGKIMLVRCQVDVS